MTNENKTAIAEEEYQFPSDEYVVHDEQQSLHSGEETHEGHEGHVNAEEEQQQQGNQPPVNPIASVINRLPSFLKNKRILLTLVAVLVGFIGIKIFTGTHTPKKVAQQPAVEQQQPTTSLNSQVLSQLSNLQQTAVNDEETVDQLKSTVSSLQNSVQNSQAANASLLQAVQSLTAKVQSLSQEVKQLSARPTEKSEGPKITYHLTAVVSGRAWVENNFGKATTVRVGDVLKPYGEIMGINAQEGFVFTSSGKTIKYGVNDY